MISQTDQSDIMISDSCIIIEQARKFHIVYMLLSPYDIQ